MSKLADSMNNVRGPDRPGLSMGGKLSDMFANIGKSLQGAAESVTGVFTNVIKKIGGSVKAFLGPIGTLMNIFEALGIMQPILDVLNGFVSIIGVAFMPLVLQIVNMLTPFLPTFQALMTALTPLISIIFNFLIPLNALALLIPYINTGLTLFTDALNGVNWTAVQDFMAALPMKIVEWIGIGLIYLRDFFVGLPNWIGEQLSDLGSVVVNTVKGWFS